LNLATFLIALAGKTQYFAVPTLENYLILRVGNKWQIYYFGEKLACLDLIFVDRGVSPAAAMTVGRAVYLSRPSSEQAAL
jgi:hypothetical protein